MKLVLEFSEEDWAKYPRLCAEIQNGSIIVDTPELDISFVVHGVYVFRVYADVDINTVADACSDIEKKIKEYYESE